MSYGGNIAGQIYPSAHFVVRQPKKAATAITRGTPAMFAATGWEPADGSSVNPLGVFTETRAAADADCQVLLSGVVLLTAGGAIKPGNFVMPDASGKVVAWDGVDNKTILGIYLYKPGQGGGSTTTLAGDAADTNKIWVLLKQGGGDLDTT